MLNLENIFARYGPAPVLEDVSIDIQAGEVVAIVGSNGAGKSSIVKVIFGLLQPESGTIKFKDEDITREPVHVRAEMGISIVPEGRHVFPDLTVEENLIMGSVNARARPLRSGNIKTIYERFPRLRERSTQKSKTLSGGEQQMLVIGRALMAEPSLLIFDEPSLGLAPKIVDDVFEIIKDLHTQGELSVLLIEQNIARALDIATRAYVLENGRITISGTSQEVANNTHVKRAYLGI